MQLLRTFAGSQALALELLTGNLDASNVTCTPTMGSHVNNKKEFIYGSYTLIGVIVVQGIWSQF